MVLENALPTLSEMAKVLIAGILTEVRKASRLIKTFLSI